MPASVSNQADLFDRPRDSANWSLADELDEHPGEEFIQRIRDELLATLALARRSATLPWGDLLQAVMAEQRVKSMSDWLPRHEADALRRDFAVEMARLYRALDATQPGESEAGSYPTALDSDTRP